VYEFKLPDLGEGVHEGEILKWYVEIGQEIGEDDPLVDIETDKAAVTIPSPKGGKVISLAGGVGDVIKVGAVVVTIDADGTGAAAPVAETASAEPSIASESTPPPLAPAPSTATTVTTVSSTATATRTDTTSAETSTPAVAPPPAPTQRRGPVPAAPATRRLARELGIDINNVPGSGPGGRITADDVRGFASGGPAAAPGVAGAPARAMSVSGIPFLEIEAVPDFEQWGEVERLPIRSIRRKVARKMVTSMVLVPHVAHADEADVTELEAFRRRDKAARTADDLVPVTMLSFIMKVVSVLFSEYPNLNASIDPEREEIVHKKYVNVGFAADTPRGLIVPVVKNTDRLSIRGISAAVYDLAVKARDGGIEVADLQGGTFTITNVGALGGTFVVPTINYPEVAILGMGRVQEKPVVRDGEIVVRHMLPLTLTFDHRIIDGAEAARFMNDLVRRLSDPLNLLVEV